MDDKDNLTADNSSEPKPPGGGGTPKTKPFWLIAHRCNDEGDIAKALADGANAIEFDVMSDGSGFIVRHPGPIDFHVPTMDEYLTAVAAEKDRLTLLYVDYKGPDFSPEARERLAGKMRELCVGARIRVVFSTASLSNKSWFGGLRQEPWLAPQFDEDNNPAEVEELFKTSGVTSSFYSDGSIALLPEPDRVEKNVRDAIQIRDRGGVLKGVAVWTLDQMSSMRKYLDLGINAIVTNDPDDLAAVLGEEAYTARYHKATKDDLPW